MTTNPQTIGDVTQAERDELREGGVMYHNLAGRTKTSEANKHADYTAYRAAGELFGRLREALGFGEFVMFTWTWCQSAPPSAVGFRWTFRAGDRRYCCHETVPFTELQNLRSVEAFANHLCDRWKREHRKTTAEPEVVS